MKKEYISFGIIGVALGLIFGFLIANWAYKGASAAKQTAASASQGSASVNSGGPNQDLPPNHPPIDSGQTIPAPPLPNSPATPAAGETPPTSTGETAELP